MSNYFKDWKKQKEAEKQIDLGTYFKFDPPADPKNKHYFMAQGLYTPLANHDDAQRLQIASNQYDQMVHLVTPEYPKIFSNFENQIGEYSISYKKADDDFVIIDKIVKNALNYDLIIQYTKTGVYDVIHYRRGMHITEEYGYGINDCIAEKEVGDTVHKGDYLYKCPSYDNEGNFMFGVNLKALYQSYKNCTYEDAVVISKSAAKKLKSYKCEETFVSINTNDVLLNIYDNGEYGQYHSFPHVGEHINNNVLVASRREENQTLLYKFQYDKMKKPEPNDDITYSGGGTVVDLDIYCNTPIEMLKKRNNEFIQEIISVLEQQNEYYKKAEEALNKILPIARVEDMSDAEKARFNAEKKKYGFAWKRPKITEDVKYTDEFGFYWKKVHEYNDNNLKWRVKGKSFQNFKLKFTILKEADLALGDKITNRTGGKGVVSLIDDDENFPVLPDGSRVDVFLNPLAIMNRMIAGAPLENFINFMSDHVVELMKKESDPMKKADLYLSYLKEIDKEQYDFFDIELMSMNRQQKADLMEEIEQNGIFIKQSPFFDNIKWDKLKEIVVNHPEWVTRYQLEGIERKVVVGDAYFIKLKHAASNKTSYVSTAPTNTKNIPSKSNMKKNHKTLFLQSPVALGNMETENLLLSKNGKVLEKLLKSYSTSKVDRENLVKQLLTAPNPFNIDVKLDPDTSINRKILDKYLAVLELSLENSDKDTNKN